MYHDGFHGSHGLGEGCFGACWLIRVLELGCADWSLQVRAGRRTLTGESTWCTLGGSYSCWLWKPLAWHAGVGSGSLVLCGSCYSSSRAQLLSLGSVLALVASFCSDDLLLAVCCLKIIHLVNYCFTRPHIAPLSWASATRDLRDALAAC